MYISYGVWIPGNEIHDGYFHQTENLDEAHEVQDLYVDVGPGSTLCGIIPLLESDKEKLEFARELIRSTDVFEQVKHDYDFTLHQAEWMLSAHLAGQKWV